MWECDDACNCSKWSWEIEVPTNVLCGTHRALLSLQTISVAKYWHLLVACVHDCVCTLAEEALLCGAYFD